MRTPDHFHFSKQQKWDLRFLDLANLIASWSKDPLYKIGAVAVDPRNRIISTGYNGLASGMHDSVASIAAMDREEKRTLMIHAEQNVIYNAPSPDKLRGSTLYVIGGLTPCIHCANAIQQVGIQTLVLPSSLKQEMMFWVDDLPYKLKTAMDNMITAGIRIRWV